MHQLTNSSLQPVSSLPTEITFRLSPSVLSQMPLRKAVSQGMSLRKLAEQGMDRLAVLYVMTKADALVGGRMDDDELALVSKTISEEFRNLSIEFIALAIRRGVTGTKVFGKITFAQVCEWVADAQAEVAQTNDEEHRSRR